MASLDWLPAAIRERSRVRELDAGEALFRQTDRAVAIFEVERGRLRLIRNTVAGHPVVLHTARPGELHNFSVRALRNGPRVRHFGGHSHLRCWCGSRLGNGKSQ